MINEHRERISFNRIDLITEKDTQRKSDRIPLLITYNRFLRNITKTIRKNWHILQINKNIQEIIGTYRIEHRRVKDLKTLKESKCTPCRSKAGNMLQTSENYNNQELRNKQNLEDISQYKL